MLRIFNAKWTSFSAGPSLDWNRRTEIFLAGCRKAEEGHPCPGCFNAEIWSSGAYVASQSPEEAFQHIKKYAPNKYITFVGGEPLDQADDLTELCKLLHNDGFNIIVITHFTLAYVENHYGELLKYIDALVDGVYDESKRIWDNSKAGDGLHDVVGSGNQYIWLFTEIGTIGAPAGDLESWQMDEGGFFFIPKDENEVSA